MEWGEEAGQSQQAEYTEIYETPDALHTDRPASPILQHEGQVQVLLASAHVDVAIVPGAGGVEEGEAWPKQAA